MRGLSVTGARTERGSPLPLYIPFRAMLQVRVEKVATPQSPLG